MQMIRLRMKYIRFIIRIATGLQTITDKLIATAQEKLDTIEM